MAALPKILQLSAISVAAMLLFLFTRADPCLAQAYAGGHGCTVLRTAADHTLTLLLLVAIAAGIGHLAARWFDARALAMAPLVTAGAFIVAFTVQQLAPRRGLLEFHAIYGWGDTLHEVSVIVLAACMAAFAAILSAWVTLRWRSGREGRRDQTHA